MIHNCSLRLTPLDYHLTIIMCRGSNQVASIKNSLLLNQSTTEALVTGTRQQVAKFNSATADSLAFQFAGTIVSRSTSIRVLGVIFDQHLTFDNHVTKLVQSYNYHIEAFCISAPTVWNSLPSAVRETSSQPQFLRRIRDIFFIESSVDHGYPAPLYRCRN